MQPVRKRVSILRVILTWIMAIGLIVGISGFFVWRNMTGSVERVDEAGTGTFHSIFLFVIGALGFVFGIIAYAVTIYTCCFTFCFDRPVWYRMRSKIFLANIIVPLMPAIGLGCIVSAIVSPKLGSRGLGDGIGGFLPYIAPIALLQIAQQIVLIEQKMDNRSNTVLGGIAHVILHVQTDAGPQRKIRLHTEGHWTLAGKKRAMDQLAQQIGTWHSTAASPPPIPT